MKKYVEYMDSVEVSDELHRRLLGLRAPKKTPAFTRYAAIAAAFVLVLGLAAIAMNRSDVVDLGSSESGKAPTNVVDPGDPGSSESDPPVEINIPRLVFADGSGLGMQAADYTLGPIDGLVREVTEADLTALFGADGAEKLDWSAFALDSGTVWFTADGTPCGLYLYGSLGEIEVLLEMTVGHEVPSCFVFADERYEKNEWQGVEIRAVLSTVYIGDVDHEPSPYAQQEVSFLSGGVGYKVTYRGKSLDSSVEFFVAGAVDGAIDLGALSPEGAVTFEDGFQD